MFELRSQTRRDLACEIVRADGVDTLRGELEVEPELLGESAPEYLELIRHADDMKRIECSLRPIDGGFEFAWWVLAEVLERKSTPPNSHRRSEVLFEALVDPTTLGHVATVEVVRQAAFHRFPEHGDEVPG